MVMLFSSDISLTNRFMGHCNDPQGWFHRNLPQIIMASAWDTYVVAASVYCQVYFPLTIFRSDSQFDKNLLPSGLKCAHLIPMEFEHIMTVLLSWCVQKSVVINQIYYEQEHYKISLNYEFDRNIITGMGSWPDTRRVNRYLWSATSNYLLPVCGSHTNMEYSTHIQTHFNSLFSKRCERNVLM